jgi:ribosome biogenesis GTPase
MQAIVTLKQKNVYEVRMDKKIYLAEISGNIKNSENHPIVGDIVNLQEMEYSERLMIKSIEPRKNKLLRPKVANIDQAIIVNSVKEPNLSTYLIDKMLAIIEYQDIEPVILITKEDLVKKDDPIYEIVERYRKDGYKIFLISNEKQTGIEELKNMIKNKLSVITGQSGVGKSTTLNSLKIELALQTQEISTSLNRGKHTTRFNKIYEIFDKSYIIDTPGFSSLEIKLTKEDLAISFHDFKEHGVKCKFNNCLHNKEPECVIKDMVESGKISKERYTNYLKLLKEITDE